VRRGRRECRLPEKTPKSGPTDWRGEWVEHTAGRKGVKDTVKEMDERPASVGIENEKNKEAGPDSMDGRKSSPIGGRG